MKNRFTSTPLLISICLLLIACGGSKPKSIYLIQSKLKSDGKNCFQQAFAVDEHLGKIRNHACEKASLSKAIKDYASGLKEIDYTDCGESFAMAFEKHRQAWLAALPVTDKYPDLRGEMHNLFSQLEAGEDGESFKLIVKSIWSTWNDIEQSITEEDPREPEERK